MKPIYKLCTACLGEGKVENLTPENMKVTIKESGLHEEPTIKRIEEECYICHGDGYIPTGFFIFEECDIGKSILKLVNEQPKDVKKVIISRT